MPYHHHHHRFSSISASTNSTNALVVLQTSLAENGLLIHFKYVYGWEWGVL
jgi:hypothetical protein